VVRVLLCDDAAAFPLLFHHWMEDCEGVELVASTTDPQAAIELTAEHQPDVIVLDHLLGAATSHDLAPSLRAAAPAGRILLISGMPQAALAQIARDTGADAYVSKALTAEAICDTVRELGRGAGAPARG
jgi:DNA-binding NarL/FixJ family response regulator